MSIRRRLFLTLFWLTITPIIALGTILIWLSYKTQEQDAISVQEQFAIQTATKIENILMRHETNAELFTFSHNLFAMKPSDAQVLLTEFMHHEGDIEEISLVRLNGDEIVHISTSRVILESELQSFTTEPEFTLPVESHQAYYSPIQISEATNKPLIVISTPIFNQRSGELEGMLIMNTELMEIWKLVEATSLENAHTVFLLASDGRVIAHPNRSLVLRGTSYLPETHNKATLGLNSRNSILGIRSFQVGSQKFTVVSEQPLSQIYPRLFRLLGTVLIILLITTAAVYYLALRMGGYISQPIITLARHAQAMEKGNLDHRIDIQSGDEIGRLARAFNAMAAQMQKNITTLTALQQSTLAIVSSLELDQVLHEILQQTTHILNTAHGFIYLVEPDERKIRMHVGTGANDKYINNLLDKGDGLSGTIWQTGRSLAIQDYQAWEGRSTFFHDTLFQAIAGAPITSGDKTVGVLGVDYMEKNAVITNETLELLEKFAQLASIAIDNARLYKLSQDEVKERIHAQEQTRTQLERIKSLRAIDLAIASSTDLHITIKVVLQGVIEHLAPHAACVAVFDSKIFAFDFVEGRGFHNPLKVEPSRVFNSALVKLVVERLKLVHIGDLTENPLYRNDMLNRGENFVAYYGIPLFTKGELRGVLALFYREPFKLTTDNLNFLESIAGQAAIAIENYTLFRSLQTSNAELHLAYETTLEGWSAALDLRDKETEGHTLRVTELTLRLAQALNVESQNLIHIRRGALLHDIGKMGVPDRILQKPGKLTDEERQIIEQHPMNAYRLLSPIQYLQQALDIPYCHHEKWDGTGYPRGLKGESIPFAARLFAVVDVYDALTSDRPYRKSLGIYQKRKWQAL